MIAIAVLFLAFIFTLTSFAPFWVTAEIQDALIVLK